MDLDLGAAAPARTGAVGASRRSAQHVTSPRAARARSPVRAPRCPRMRHYSVTRGRGAEGNYEEKGGLEVRRKVVKVTVALTARARNNIGVQLSVMCVHVCVCVCMCVYVHVC